MDTMQRFQNLINSEENLFSDTCEMMLHSQVNNGRRFLCAMNNLVEYCCSQSCKNKEGVNYHIIYLPTCPEWSRELLARFFIHKIAFTSSDEFISIAKRKAPSTIYLPEKITKKEITNLYEERAYYKKFLRLFDGKCLPENKYKKTLFILQDKDIVTRKQDKNPWLEQLYTNSLFKHDRNVVVTTTKTAFDIEDEIRGYQSDIPNIENIFVFHSQNRSRITNSYNIDQIERLNRYGVGVKNCFVFYITERPFRLYHALDNVKNSLTSNLLNREIKKYDDFDGFITFTTEELNLMFGRTNNGRRYLIDSSEREIFTAEIDSFLDELAHNYKIKNSLSLTFTEETQQEFMLECEQELGISNPGIIQPFLSIYKQLWDMEIKRTISSHIADCNTVAFVLPKWATKCQKEALKTAFSTNDRIISFVDFDDLKDGINTNAVVLFVYRYTDVKYKTFPNSFDPLPLRNGQIGLTVVNRLTHNRYYEWNNHFYDKTLNGLLYSDFRKDTIGWRKRILTRPILPDIFDNIDEAEADARDYMAERCTIQFESGRIKQLASARAIYDNGHNYSISSLKDLPFEEGMQIQMLDEIVVQIKDSLIKKSRNILKSEVYIRKDPAYGLSADEIASDVELWKYLLKRKVDATSAEDAYEAIFPSTKEISMNGFQRWLDFSNPMISPRSRKSQNNLLNYLGFNIGGPYHRVILTKKMMRNSDTRLLNSQIESLLQSILTVSIIHEEDFDDLFEAHSEILTLLEVRCAADINTLIELLDIDLKKVISIKYDSHKA